MDHPSVAEASDPEIAISAAEAGASVVLAKYGGILVRHDKSPTDFATDADLEAERQIVETIRAARPADAVEGEEYGSTGDSPAARRWLVDPLCGTVNFAAQTPLFSVNVALVDHDETVAAAVVQPLSRETFWTDGVSAWVRRAGMDSPAVPSSDSRLVDINIDGPADGGFLGPQLLADHALRAAFGLRVSSTTLPVAWVAVGRRAAYVTDGDLRGSVHFTAGLALTRAAGCVITDLRGQPLHTGAGAIVASDHEVHATLLTIVSGHLPAR